MYIPGFGSCSSIIHLIAKYPLVTLGVGLLAASAYLAPTLGTRGSDPAKILREQGVNVAKSLPELERQLPEINKAFAEVKDAPLTDNVIQRVLDACAECENITPAMVRHDEQLFKDVAYLYFLDLCHAHGLAVAKVYFTGRP